MYLHSADLTQTCSMAGTSLSQDGCSVQFNFLPPIDSSSVVLVHEIGHWLGLRHTFVDKSCTESDFDGIEDTPKHRNPQDLPDKKHEQKECLPISSCGVSWTLGCGYVLEGEADEVL